MLNKSETKVVYAYAVNGKLIGKKILDYTDRSPVSGTWQLPAQTTNIEPPAAKENYDLHFKNDTWEYVEQKIERDTDIGEATVTTKDNETIDPAMLDLAEAVLELSNKVEKLEGGSKL